jgi:hypothetical protein
VRATKAKKRTRVIGSKTRERLEALGTNPERRSTPRVNGQAGIQGGRNLIAEYRDKAGEGMSERKVDEMTGPDVCAAIRAVYDGSRRSDGLEPTHPAMFFAPAFSGEADADTIEEYRSFLKAQDQPPYIVERITGGKHVVEKGVLIACTSWIFMARAQAIPKEYRGWIIIDRELSPEVKALESANKLGKGHPTRFFMAYRRDTVVGMSGMTGEEIGPCQSLAEVEECIDETEAEDGGAER